MTGVQFVQEVKAKLNRLDTEAYEDVRSEEVLFFGWDALKYLILEFDEEHYKGFEGEDTIRVYLAALTKHQTELALVANKIALPDLFKLKDVEAYVEVDSEKGWQTTRDSDNIKASRDEYNPFLKSYPDMPEYRLVDNKIEFHVNGFTCTKIRYTYLEYPPVITESSDLDMVFIMELQNRTVTLILENLESRRIQSQPAISKS